MSDRSFHSLAVAAERINATRGTNAKTRICAGYRRSLEEEEDLELAAQFLAEGAFSDLSGKRASVGSRTYSTAAAQFCEIDYDKVFKPCKTALGSASEAIQKLTANIEAARARRDPDRPTLQEVRGFYEELYGVSSRADKQDILHCIELLTNGLKELDKFEA